MTCETARTAISLRLDGEGGDTHERGDREDLERHLEDCAACRAFDERSRLLRTQLRYEALDEIPDLAPRVRAAVADLPPSRSARARGSRRARLVAVAASFLVGALIGALLVVEDGTNPGPVAAADIPAQVAAAQFDLHALDAQLELVERGWHADIDERRWMGNLSWRAPETLSLELRDRTSYPSEEWVEDDVSLVVDEDRYWTRGPRDCPSHQQPDCTVAAPRVEGLTGREPFSDDAAVPLDLLVPVRSFAGAAPPADLGERTISGRRAVGVATTAAQVQPVLDGLGPAGNLREAHPADPVALWLDAQTMVPLAVAVTAGEAPDRAAWAANRGYRDRLGDIVLEMTVTAIDYEPPALSVDPPPEGTTAERAAGFTDEPTSRLEDLEAPPGFTLHRSGRLVTGGPIVEVTSWTDGRGWVKVRATTEWPGGSLFGQLGPLVRTADLGEAGVAYLNPAGDRVALHGDDIDVVVTGSVGEDRLRQIAADLGVVGRPVPPDWLEAASASVDEAVAALPGLLLPSALDGFGKPSMRADGSTIVASYTGPGARAFLLTESPGNRLTPPLDLSVTAVEVRGGTGRWSSARGELEWSEAGLVLSLRSTTLSLNELLAVAHSMEPA